MAIDFSTALSGLKYFAILLGGAFGVLALAVDYKDASGHLTRWGRIAIFGVIAASGTSVATQALESFRAEMDSQASARAAAENLRESKLALAQIERLIEPIGAVRVTVVWKFPDTIPSVGKYLSEISAFGHKLQNDPQLAKRWFDQGNVTFKHADGGRLIPIGITICANSSLYPDPKRQQELYSLLVDTGANISVFATSQSAASTLKMIEHPGQKYEALGFLGTSGDLGFDVNSQESPCVDYAFGGHSLLISFGEKIDPNFLRKTGNIVSIHDLERSSVVLSTDNASFLQDPDARHAFKAALDQVTLGVFTIDVAGHEYLVLEDNVVRETAGTGAAVFSFGPLARVSENKI